MRLLIGVLLLAAGAVTSGSAQSRLHFEVLGLAPGLAEDAAADTVRGHGGSLRCRPTAEPRLRQCSAALPGSPRGPVTLTLSFVDGRLAVALIAAMLDPDAVGDWHAELVARHGEVTPTRGPGQESFQWVAAGRMMRFTVRREAGRLMVSVSLVDGPLLDSLPAPQALASRLRPA